MGTELDNELQRLGIGSIQQQWMNIDYSNYPSTVEPRIHGNHPRPWGRGSTGSTPSSYWVMSNLLNKLVEIPGVHLFYELKTPGRLLLDVEHFAVTHGSVMYLIESCFSLGTAYGWQVNRRGNAFLMKGDDGHRHTLIANAADRYRSLLGPNANVVPLVTVVSGKATISGERWSPRGVGLFTAEESLAYIGDSAAGNLPRWRDNPDMRDVLQSTLAKH